MAATLRGIAPALCSLSLIACGGDSGVLSDGPPLALRIYHSPYAEVEWSSTVRIKAQHHDHAGAQLANIRAYDAAGYQAFSLMTYSGAPALPYALTERLWPPEKVGLTTTVMRSFRNIAFFIPNAEEVGETSFHITSPFLTTYIENFTRSPRHLPSPWQYSNPQELIDKIRAYGGIPLLAHPWNDPASYASLRDFRGVEIYSAFAEARKRQGESYFTSVDRNARLISLWDSNLATNQSLIGISVNDHYGPDSAANATDPEIRDSGKIMVFASAMTLDAYRAAFELGALVAIKDIGRTKDQYPVLRAVSVEGTSVLLDTDGAVRWIANSRAVGSDSLLDYKNLPNGTTYVRAEISNADGSTVFTQAFSVRPVGDADGDGDVDANDQSVCTAVRSGTDTNLDHVAAC